MILLFTHVKYLFMTLNQQLMNYRQGKIKKMKEKNVNTPIVISNDNFIIDGHHRWYSQKMNNGTK